MESYDYLNTNHYRNSANTAFCDYNCGGYALMTYNWYLPYYNSTSDHVETIEELWDEGYSIEDIYSFIIDADIANMLSDFPQLRQVDRCYDLKPSERLIAYRFYAIIDELSDGYIDVDSDFHYRFKDYGDTGWKEKRGSCPCEELTEEDNKYWGDYDSKICYFVMPIPAGVEI